MKHQIITSIIQTLVVVFLYSQADAFNMKNWANTVKYKRN